MLDTSTINEVFVISLIAGIGLGIVVGFSVYRKENWKEGLKWFFATPIFVCGITTIGYTLVIAVLDLHGII